MRAFTILCVAIVTGLCTVQAQHHVHQHASIPADIAAVFNKPLYKGAVWGSESSIWTAGKS